LKHIIHRAAKEGYDRVAFINGEQSHKRFPQKKDGSSTRGAFSSFYGEPTGEVVNDIEEPQKGKSPMLHTALNKLLPKIKGGKLSHVMLHTVKPRKYSEDEIIEQFPGGVTDAMRQGDIAAKNYIAKKMSELNADPMPTPQVGFDITPEMREQLKVCRYITVAA
jgi:hypothetical protein